MDEFLDLLELEPRDRHEPNPLPQPDTSIKYARWQTYVGVLTLLAMVGLVWRCMAMN